MPIKAAKSNVSAIETKSLRLPLLALEPRYVFDAALGSELAEHAFDAATDIGDHTADVAQQAADLVAAAHEVDAAGPDAGDAGADQQVTMLVEATVAAHNLVRTTSEIVFIDNRLEGLPDIVSAVPDGTRIVLIDSASDAVSQITSALEREQGVTGVHIISHGTPGSLQIGNATLNADTMSTIYRDALTGISDNLAEGADILIYGCNFGDGTEGAQAAALLSELTGADVASSDDLTGSEALGGDWELEQRTGFVDTRVISAPEWDNTLAPLVITVTAQPTRTGASGANANNGGLPEGGAGMTAVWTNAGTIGGTPIDVKATLVSLSTGTASFNTSGDDLSFWINNANATAVVKWEIFASGTNQTVYAVGSPNLQISDIDGTGGVPNSREIIRPQLNGLTSFTLEGTTNLIASTSVGGVNVSGTQNQTQNPPIPVSMAGFTWQEVSSWTVEYQLTGSTINANFRHDGDGDFVFAAPNTTYLLALDLDANNSTATGYNYQTTYTENGTGVSVVDVDEVITQHSVLGTDLGEASITLTNKQAGDQLNVGTLPAGITASVVDNGTTITVTLSGTAPVSDYTAALKAITFSSSSETPSTTDRNIEINVTNTTWGTTSNTATSTIHVTAVNDPPVANTDTYTVAEDSTGTVLNLLPNDTDADNDTLTITSIAGTALTPGVAQTISVPNGTVNVSAGGAITFDPAPNYFGPVTFDYTITDGAADVQGTVDITVTNVNDNPVANDDTFNVNEDSGATVLNVLPNDGIAPDTGETLTVTAVTQPANGTVTLVGGVVSYTPNPDFFGTDTFTYTISDGNGGTDTATVTVNVANVNDNPVANDDTFNVNEDSGATVLNVLPNDGIAPDTGETLTVTAVTQPANGTVTLVGGVVSYTPNPDFFGTDTFTYAISDGNGGTDTATVTVNVANVNDNPTANDDTFNVNEDSGATVLGVLPNDGIAPDTGETLTVTAVTQPANGTVTLVGGVVSYTPNPDFFGTETFTYTISDGNGGTDTATVTVNVANVNDNPVANDDTFNVNEDSGATVLNVLPNDGIAPDTGETLTVTAVTQPTNGTVTLVGGVVSYTPNPDFFGTDTFTYTISDGNGGTDTATVTVNVANVNDDPTAIDDTFNVNEDAGATVLNVLPNDGIAPDTGETLTVTAVTQPANGTVTLVGGVVSYTPNPDFFGTDTFTYTISDGNGGTDTATVTVNVANVNDNPTAVDDTFNVNEDSGATVLNVLPNDGIAPDTGETLTVTAVTQPANGTVTLVGGVVSYTPNPDFFGTDTFTYTISDGNGGTDTATVTVNVANVNDNPVANDDTFNVNEDSGATVLNVLPNDGIAPDTGETLTVTAVTQPANGTVTLVGGVVSYTPNPDYFGTDTFTYTISDGNGGTDTATVTVNVANVNDDPVANDDTFNVNEDSGATVLNVLPNDGIAPDTGETLTVTAVTQPANGTVTLVGGVVSYTPNPDFFGTETFTYTISDGNGGTDTATVTVNVANVNDNPVANDDTFNVNEDSGATVLNVLPNDGIAPDTGETLTVTAVTQPTNGTVTLVGGVVSYTPNPDFFGTDTFTYTISDGNGGTDTATVTVNVANVNDNPVANDDTFNVNEDSGATVLNVLPNDGIAPDTGETLTVTAVTQPANGTVTLVGGVVSYTPNPDYFGTDTFTYTISDGNGGTDTATVTVNVANVNDNPTAVDDTFNVNEDSGATVLNVLPNDGIAPDTGETLTVTAVTQPANGTVTLVGGVVSYTPNPDFFGTDTFTYTISDGNGGTDTATVTVNVANVNDNPVANDDTFNVNEDSGATVLNVLPNDGIAPDTGETLTVTAVTQPTNGTVTLVGGVVSYTPNPDFFGTDTFTYTISDGNGGTDTATVTVNVANVNDNPVANDDTFNVNEDSGATVLNVLPNDGIAPDTGETLTVTAVTQPANGTVTLVGGVVSYTPNPDYFGTDTFTYTISDGNGGTDTATVTVNVANVNDNPTAVDDTFNVNEDSGATVLNVLPNDGIAPDTGETLTVTAVTQPANGTVTLVGGVVSYTPNPDFFGTDTFTYTISDGNGGTDTATVTVNVANVNDNPVANDDTFNVNEDSGATVLNVLPNDGIAPDTGETLTVTAVTQPTNGTVTLVGGVVSYTPNPDFFGTDTFTYTISDGNGGTDTATVTVNVANVNDDPTAVDDTFNVNEDSGATVLNVLPNDGIAPDTGETLTVTAVTQPTNGTVTLVGGVVSYTPNPDFFGTDTFTYTISDGNGGTDTATVTVNVANVNDDPTAVDDTFNVNEDSGATVLNVLPNDGIAPDTGETLTVTAVTQPTNGTVTLVGGVVSYTPNPDFFGTDTFTYTISDGNGGTDTATVTVNVANVNDNPDAVDDTFNVNEDSGATVLDVLPNDGIAPDTGETLTVTAVTQPANGTVTLVGGVVSYTPNPDYFGTDTFTYTISDGNGGTDTATVTVNVANVNDNPVDGDDVGTVTEDTPLTVPAGSGLLSNASDIESNPLAVTEFTVAGTTYPVAPGTPGVAVLPGAGTLTINSDGSYSFSPAANYNGPIPAVTYTVSDGQGGSDTSTLTLTVVPVNDAPEANPDSVPVVEDTPVSGNVLTNDTDTENDALTVTQFQIGTTTYPAGTPATIPDVGTLVINPDGTFTFDPAPNYNGPVPPVVYTVTDGNGGTDTATLTLGPVVAVNDAPVAVDDTATVAEDTTLTGSVLSNDTDVDNNPLKVTSFTIGGKTYAAGATAKIPGVGTLVMRADGSYIFKPAANYNGPVPVATYTVADGKGGTDRATLTINVTPVNDAPVAVHDTTKTRFGTPVVVNLTANDIDVENGPLTVKSASVPANQGTLVKVAGVWKFVPAKGFTGTATITYTIRDPQGAESTSTHNVIVGLPPIAAKDDKHIGAYNTAFTSTVASNDVYESGSKFAVVKQPDGGTVVMRSDGTFKFTPKRGFSGVVTFTYRVTDRYGQTVTAKETITVATEKHNCLVTFGKIKK